MMKWGRCLTEIIGFLLLFCVVPINAQSLRDPTVAPVEAGQGGGTVGGKSPGVELGPMTIIVRNGRPYLVVGTRLYAQGQQFGPARIERISETEVWLREGGGLRKVAQFSGIQRRTVPPVLANPVCTSSPSKPSSPVAPCAGVQP